MTNYEKYSNEINNFKDTQDFCKEFVIPCILKTSNCNGLNCAACRLRQTAWLFEEYIEPAIDTPIVTEDVYWHKVQFAKDTDEEEYAWLGDGTNWTSDDIYTYRWVNPPKDKE